MVGTYPKVSPPPSSLASSLRLGQLFGLSVMMMADIHENQTDIVEFGQRISKVEQMVQSQAVSMARIDVNIEHIRTSVEKMADRR